MRLLKQAMAVLGTVTMIAVLVAVFAPKTAHAVAAALVQIEPGTTTQVGQNESQLVSLGCFVSQANYCVAVDATGNISYPYTAYVVPAGYTLIVTDWEWYGNNGAPASQFAVDHLANASGGFFAFSAALLLTVGTSTYSHEHYTTGLRVGSGVTISDTLNYVGDGQAYVQGYLVPN